MKLIHQLLDQEPAMAEFQMSAFGDLSGQPVVGATHWTDFKWFRPVFSYWWQDVNAHCTNRRHLQDDSRRFCIGPLSYEKVNEIWIIGSTKNPYLLREIPSGNIYSLRRCISMGLWMAISRTTDSSKALNRLLLCRQHRKTHIFLMLLLTKNIQR
jgi:hypothetical protein